MDVSSFVARWSASGASERANKDSYLRDLCDVLAVPHPEPCMGDRARDAYVFEADAVVPHEGGTVTIGKIDLYKAGCFVLEAKQGSDAGALTLGTARRGTPTWNIAMRDAFGQALGYARTLPEPPPFLIVTDIGHCFDLYAAFDGTLDYRPFPDAQSSRLFLTDLAKHVPTLKQLWTDPHVLDPACGTGNFLYVALDTFKRLESEVLALLADLGDTQAAFGARVTPAQFLGIEVKPWAREIADLVLWLGFLSWNARITGKAAAREPVLESYGNIECRDAVLAWDRIEPVLDAVGKPVTRWDGVTTKVHPVTGKDVPDERAAVVVERYVNPGAAVWPQADFVVGNPPYIGTRRLRDSLGDAYVDALRAAYPDVPETADLVMYWWQKAAESVSSGRAQRFGFITTNSIVQAYCRVVMERWLGSKGGVSLAFAIADHPWVEANDGAAVRVAMTVGVACGTVPAMLGVVTVEDGERVEVANAVRGPIGPDLRVGAAVTTATALAANRNMCFQGVVLAGAGFKLGADEFAGLASRAPASCSVIHRHLSGRDLVQRPPETFYVIDLFGLTDVEAAALYPEVYQRLLDTVYPERRNNSRDVYRKKWWMFAEPRPAMRRALQGLVRYVGTPNTSTHRPFVFLEGSVRPDSMIYAVASDDAFVLGVLSSRAHTTWAATAGGRLGVGNDSRYNSNATFAPYPFPTPNEAQTAIIRELGERLDAHRKSRQAAHPDLTLTGMYNVLVKLRSGESLTDKERVIHDHGLVSILREIHDALDAAVLDAYGWPRDLDDEGILTRLVALNAERAAEEKRGLVRWLRPEYQRPLAGEPIAENLPIPVLDALPAAETTVATTAKWPASLSDRIAAVRGALDAGSDSLDAEQVARRFKGARRADVAEILDSLTALGLALGLDTAAGRRWRGTRAAA